MIASASPPPQRDEPPAALGERRARELAALAKTRIANGWLRLATCALVAFLAVGAGMTLPFFWLAGFAPIVVIERAVYKRLLTQCEAGAPTPDLIWPAIWIFAQTAYVGGLAVFIWFAKYSHGETLAVILMLASLGNAAATLRSSSPLALAAALPTVALLVMLPLLDYFLGEFHNPLDLVPVVGAILFVGFGVNLWTSLRASDEAQARAEIAAVRERKSAAAAAAAKSETIKRMQDELRTPMSALISAAEHLRRAAVSPEARAHIGALAQAGEVVRVVLDDLSDLDRLENGQLRIALAPCDPREIARSVVGAFRAVAHDKRLELFLDIAPDVPALVEMDAARVRQVLFNLVANALKFTHHGGVRLKLQVQAADAPGRVRLGYAVADTGVGMSRSQLALIFGRGRAAGPGLGLAISVRLARLMGAKIGAKSEVGEGSVFSFVIEAPLLGACSSNAAA
ncbi:MAG: HAMP domain-containing sensor histidine kinase [Pseudomonadota bacterium]